MKIYWKIFVGCLVILGVMSSCKDDNEGGASHGVEMMITGFTPEQGYSSNEGKISVQKKTVGRYILMKQQLLNM